MLAFGHRLAAAGGIDRGPPPSPFAVNSSTAIFVPAFRPAPDLRGFTPPSTILDKYEAVGIKALRNRVTTLRLWLQLWDSRSGHIVWESSGEVMTATVFLSPRQTIALEQTAKKLLVRMIQDGLIDSKTETQVIQDH